MATIDLSQRYARPGFLTVKKQVMCRDCSTRNTGYILPEDEIELHEMLEHADG